MLRDRKAIALAFEESGIDVSHLPTALKSAQASIVRLRSKDATPEMSELVDRVDLSREGLTVSLNLPLPRPEGGDRSGRPQVSLVKFVAMEIKRRGVEMKMVLGGYETPSHVDLPLLKAVARARKWSNDLLTGQVQSVGALAKREGLDRRSVRRLLRLGFLSPRIVETIAEGRQPPELTVIGLTRRLDLPLLWSAQEPARGTRRTAAASTVDA